MFKMVDIVNEEEQFYNFEVVRYVYTWKFDFTNLYSNEFIF